MLFTLVTLTVIATADSTGSRWVAPSSTEEAKPFAGLLVLERVPNATDDTVHLQALSSDRAAYFAPTGGSCGAASPRNSTAVVAWRGTATDTSLFVCAQAGPEGTDFLVARIARGGTPERKEETIVSNAIVVGAGKRSTLSLGVITGLLGAVVTLALFIVQEWFKRWNDGKKEAATRAQDRIDDAKKREEDRIDAAKKRDEDRADQRLELSDKVMNLMVTEIHANETRLSGFVEENGAPVILSISAAQTVLRDTPLQEYLQAEAKDGFVDRWTSFFAHAAAFNTAVATHNKKADAERAASLEALRQEGKVLLTQLREASGALV